MSVFNITKQLRRAACSPHEQSIRWVAALAITSSLCFSPPLFGQGADNDTDLVGTAAAQARGTSVDSAFHFGGVDSINLFNGNLSIQIPLGQSYPVGAGLEYGLNLVYNSNIWDYDEHCRWTSTATIGPDAGAVYDYAHERPAVASNAGLGWMVDLGRILVPGNLADWGEGQRVPDDLTYVASDGSQHAFFSSLQTTIPAPTDSAYTTDGSYLRLRPTPASCMQPRNSQDLTLEFSACTGFEVDLPDGSIQTFTNFGSSDPLTPELAEWRITRMEDAFGNGVDISYSNGNVPGSKVWTMTDDFGRHQEIELYPPEIDDNGTLLNPVPEVEQGLRIHEVRLEGFGNTDLTYRFDYILDFVERHKAGDNLGEGYLCADAPQSSSSLQVYLLDQLTAMEGSTELLSYGMHYYLDTDLPTSSSPGTVGTKAGALARLRLPTGGGYGYTYGRYAHGHQLSHLSHPPQFKISQIDSVGVFQKQILETVSASPPNANEIEGTWLYTPNPSLDLEAPWDEIANYPFTSPDRPVGIDPCFLETTVTDPVGNRSVHYFNTARVGFVREFGLPYTVCNPDTRVFFDFDGDGVRDTSEDPRDFRPISAGEPDSESYPTIGAAPDRFLSSRVLGPLPSGGGPAPILRETYVLYDLDDLSPTYTSPRPLSQSFNSRVLAQETCYLDDPGSTPSSICGNFHWRRTENRDFDGFGNFRISQSRSSFGGADWAQTAQNFNPLAANAGYPWSSGYQEGQTLPLADFTTRSWILGLSTWSEVDQQPSVGGETSVTLTCYDEQTGFLEGRRSFEDRGGPGKPQPGANDLLTRYSANSSGPGNLGFPLSENYYGGNGQTLSAGNGCQSPSSLTPEYRVEATYAFGALEQAWYLDGTAQFLEVGDFDIDPDTGLTSTSSDPSGVQAQFEYDALGRLSRTCTPGVGVSTTSFDLPSAGEANPESTIDTQAFDTSGGSSCAPGQRIQQQQSIFDGHGRLIREAKRIPQRQSNGTYTSILAERSVEVDALGRQVRSGLWTSPGSGLTSASTDILAFDSFGRPLEMREPDGALLDISYLGDRVELSTVGIRTGATEQDATTRKQRDGLGRLVSLENLDSSGSLLLRTSYGYDESSNLVQVCVGDGDTDPQSCAGGQQRFFGYDGRGVLASETHPEFGANGGGTISYSYDSRRNPLTKTSSDPSLDLSYLYDPAARVTQVRASSSNGLLTEYFYARQNSGSGLDTNRSSGKLVTTKQHHRIPEPVGASLAADIVVTESYSYVEPAGRLSKYSVRSSLGPSFTSTINGYDALDTVLSLTYPQCDHFPCTDAGPPRTVEYQTVDGSVTAVVENGAVFANGFNYNFDGDLNRIGHRNGVTDLLDQDSIGWRLGQVRSAGIQGGDWLYGPYSYDDSGNITEIGLDNQFRYDLLNRLASAQISVTTGGTTQSATQTATYDPFGNLASLTGTGSLMGPSPGSIAHSQTTNRLNSFSYDANGNALVGNLGTEPMAHSWDPLNRMMSLQAGTVGRAYLYTASGERLATLAPALDDASYTPRSATNQVLRRFKKAGSQPWTWDEDYVYAGGRQLGAMTDSGDRHFHLDHLGNVRRITDSAGAITESKDLYPFGGYVVPPVVDAEEFQFTGHERDANGSNIVADLDYMHARYYTPYLGRFLSVDPLNGNVSESQSWNRYTYVQNDPLGGIDPNGEIIFKVIKSGVKLALKGGDVAATFAGVIEDAKTIADPDASFGQKFVAGLSLATEVFSPVSLRDGKAIGKAVGAAGAAGAAGDARRLDSVDNAAEEAGTLARSCFPAETMVWTGGGLEPIQNIEVGQSIVCADTETGMSSLCKVEELLRQDFSGRVFSIAVENEVIHATGTHPFWVEEGTSLELRPLAVDAGPDGWPIEGQGRWVEAGDLQVRDILLLVDGQRIEVLATSSFDASLEVFNLRVSDLKTFAVGKNGLLVHNKALSRKPGSQGQFKGRDALRRENKQVRDVVKQLGLNEAQRRQLHDEISGEGLDFHQIRETAEDLFGRK